MFNLKISGKNCIAVQSALQKDIQTCYNITNDMGDNKMNNKALVVIDIQNDITKNYKDIIDNINRAVE